MRKKAAIELSVTAIIVLILAIVILGLGLGFIRGMFGKVATQFEEQIAAEPQPATPTGSEPITLSRESLIVRSSDPVALKVGIYNPTASDWATASFKINCSKGGVITNEQFNEKELNSGESFIGTYLFQIGKVSEGVYLCQGGSINNTLTNATLYTKDITIKVLR